MRGAASHRARARLAGILFAAGWFLLAAERVAFGQDAQGSRRSSLHWVRLAGSEECIGSLELSRAIEQRLGRPVFVPPTQADVTVEGHVATAEGGFRATLSISRPDGTILGTRELSTPGPSCRDLDEGLTVVLSLLIDPEPTPLGPEIGSAPEERSGGEETAPFHPSAHLAVLALAGPLPTPALGMQAGAAWGPRRWQVGLAFLSTLSSVAEHAAKGGTFRLYAGELSLCRLFFGGVKLEAGLCLGAQVGAITGEGRGLELSSTATLPYVSAVARGRVSLELAGPLWVGLDAGLLASVVRPAYFYTELGEDSLLLERRQLARTKSLGALGAVRVEWKF